MSGINRINSGATLPLSTNLSVNRQTPDMSFGKRVQAGVNATGSVVGAGLGMGMGIAGSSFGGGPAILSAAVSSTMALGAQRSSGAVSAAYNNNMSSAFGPTIGTGGGSSTNPTPGGSTSPEVVSHGTTSVEDMRRENTELLGIQIQLQRENQLFSSLSNSLKTRHDTAKNSIANMR